MTWPQGILFRLTKQNEVRAVYEQCDGEIILASDCICRVEHIIDPETWDAEFPNFAQTKMVVIRSIDCPVDEHKAEALQRVSN